MTTQEAFQLVANLDFKESHRRYAPQYGLLQFNHLGEVVSVYRFKRIPHEAERYEALTKHPRCLQISTRLDWFADDAALQERIDKELWLFAHMKPTNR